jgi:hypothetical protein
MSADPKPLDLTCKGVLALEQIGGMLVVKQDDAGKYVEAVCLECGHKQGVARKRVRRTQGGWSKKLICRRPWDGWVEDK